MIYKNALISVSNKEGLEDCAKKLSQSGTRIVSTGGTAQFLSKHGVPIVSVEEQTQFPEVMDGRVKTLHPHIFLPLLARLNNPQDEEELKQRNLPHFDLVICNLYPFDEIKKDNEKEQIELIDVGGPSLLRASAKNFEKITVVCDPKDYHLLEDSLSLEQRRSLSVKTFYHLSVYDSNIAQYFQQRMDPRLRGDDGKQGDGEKQGDDGANVIPAKAGIQSLLLHGLGWRRNRLAPAKAGIQSLLLHGLGWHRNRLAPAKAGIQHTLPYIQQGSFFKKLRYGENPNQQACWYTNSKTPGLHQAEILQGKELSFNNILDIQSALNTLREFQEPAFVGVKHNNPCGVALADFLETAIEKGLKADPLSIFGGIVALNKKVSSESAVQLNSCFLECIIAPDYSENALNLLSKKKNLRILKWPNLLDSFKENLIYTIDGGFLVQNADQVHINWKNFKIEGPEPITTIKKDLEIAWKVCAHLKSNAIALVSQGQTVGLGMGQVDRVTAVSLAVERMKKHHTNISSPIVMASDGFFPFEDSIKQASAEGIKWVIQPGGSIRDSSVIGTARALGVHMVLTGCRHFRH
ncbi:MAG: hypothetical protein OXK80_04020 [Bdellovibrionales bacterium]|nr:hypothetical protein [Bdellovibrionales bacterium]